MDLVINTYGSSLHRDNDAFVIVTKKGRQRVPADSVRSVQVSKGTQLTSDAILLAIEHEVEILFFDGGGVPRGRVWSPKYGSVSSIRKGQVNFTLSHDSVIWIKDVLIRKLENQQAIILLLKTDEERLSRLAERSIVRLEDYKNKIKKIDGDYVSDIAPSLRGWEGVASKIYFETVNEFIPEKYRFQARSQRPALDIANAMLNYGYGILYGRIEGAMIKSGIDPYIGVMHRDDYNRPVLVYDVIECYRVWVDYVVFRLLVEDVITEECYAVRDDGSYWLEALGRRMLIQSLSDYMDENVKVRSMVRSRYTHMTLDIQSLAQKFKDYDS